MIQVRNEENIDNIILNGTKKHLQGIKSRKDKELQRKKDRDANLIGNEEEKLEK